jgi:A/G-specific adenine glycosylase
MTSGQKQNKAFKKTVLDFYKKNGRGYLPWRKNKNAYRVLVSEIMLQQTQVDRVIPKYNSFLKKFPSVRVLAKAPLSSVLREWQGLGYNRRAKMLHQAAKVIAKKYKGVVPSAYDELLGLPGVGPYTACAVRVFAFNQAEALIETNVRSVYLHHFFPKKEKVADTDILPLLEETLDVRNPRVWYSALMDYGSYLKSVTENPSRRSVHHTVQKPFKGSDREIRGVILKELSQKSRKREEFNELGFPKERVATQLAALIAEGFISYTRGRYRLSD